MAWRTGEHESRSVHQIAIQPVDWTTRAIILLLPLSFPLYLFECLCIWKSLTDFNVGALKYSPFCWNNIFEVFAASLNLMIFLEIWNSFEMGEVEGRTI